MKSYCVFSGGGLKGAAHAGALEEAHALRFDFVGYGGTSAGALVATLAAAGLPAVKIKEAMLPNGLAHSSGILNEGDLRLDALVSVVRKGLSLVNHGGLRAFVGWVLKTKLERLALRKLADNFGLLTGLRLRQALVELLAEQLEIDQEAVRSMSVIGFCEITGKQLKLVAADVWSGEPMIFSSETTPHIPLMDALLASSAYPFVFSPLRQSNGKALAEVLVDGGLVSNTPAFLFFEESALTKYPTFVFQLRQGQPDRDFPKTLAEYAQAMVHTVVNGSDSIIGRLLPRTHVIDIFGHDRYDVLGSHSSAEEIERLFRIGREVKRRLSESLEYRRVLAASEASVSAFTATYGNPDAFETVLSALCHGVGSEIAAAIGDVRAGIFLPDEDGNWGRAYSFGYGKSDPAVEDRLGIDTPVGASAAGQEIVVADLRKSPSNALLRRFFGNAGTLIAYPVFQYDHLSSERSMPIVAVIAVDLSDATPILSLFESKQSKQAALNRNLATLLQEWSIVLSRLLVA